jgi:hypothetical protein
MQGERNDNKQHVERPMSKPESDRDLQMRPHRIPLAQKLPELFRRSKSISIAQ